MDVVLPLLSTIVSFVFAGTVFSQYISRRKPHQLVWTVGLVSYGLGALMEFLTGIGIFNRAVYSTWYLFGAILVAAYLGMGTVYLMVPRKTANIVMGLLVAASVVALLMVLTAKVDMSQVSAGAKLSGKGMPENVRLLTPFFNIFGTVTLFGGAAWSAWTFWRRGTAPQRALSNALIAVGAILPAIGGSLLRFDIPGVFYLFEFLGVTVIFIGFLSNYEIVASRLAMKVQARPST